MDNLLGTRLEGRYLIEQPLGAGGMANVYKGQDVTNGRPVAIKVLRQEFMDNADLVRRFKNEAKAVSLLDHPNITKVYDVGVGDQLQYIVMEYIDGITLKEYMAVSYTHLDVYKRQLLLNRRGYKTVGMCTQCGQVLKCQSCSVPMVYHKAEDKLLCHYCGAVLSPVPDVCPDCGGAMKYTGFGTQRVEEELAQLFPAARILRMDLDTTSRKNAHETMLRRFAAGEYDIMLGTQMVAKGLDFEKVTLVGVLGIDQMLFAQGYKAFENVFDLVTQVVGRGGRADQPGRALIQTVDPEHPVLQLAAKQDYASFYKQEIEFRRLNLYPPFCTICMAGFTGGDEAAVQRAARQFAGFVTDAARAVPGIPLRILGPAPMNVAMVAGRYRYKLTLKCRNDKTFRGLLRRALDAYNASGAAAKATIYLDFYSDADV